MSVLDELVAGALEDQQARERALPLETIKRMAADAPAPIDVRRWLKREDGVPVIAEIKRASPSKGYLGDIPDPAALARQYEAGGASAISVLTEGRRFLGSLDDFDQVRAAVHIPLLRKDFMVNEYQVWESRAHGADIVLLIVAALDDDTLSRLLKLSESLGMTVLVEAHNREEIARAVAVGATVIGINARNLKNLHVDVSTYGELAADLPSNVIRVAESGVFGSVEVDDYARAGADTVLVGEGVATADDHEEAVRTLVAAGARVKASEQRPLSTHEGPYFGQFGGRYVPEALVGALDELETVYEQAKADPEFHKEFARLNRQYVGRPSSLTEAPRFAERIKAKTGLDARVFLKREDLNHTGAHKINNALGQALLAKKMGKTRLIAETGAGQHGVATATAAALLGMDCVVYMGEEDTRRQALNVYRMRLLGAQVVPVSTGTATLKDAVSEAMREWTKRIDDTHYCLGSVMGPHPFPTIVRDFQAIISREIKQQLQQKEGEGRLPDAVVACVGGGSNAIGSFYHFIDDPSVRLIGCEAAGRGIDTFETAATINTGRLGIFHGMKSYFCQDNLGQIAPVYSISAGLDYPGVGPEHAWLNDRGRAEYVPVTDEEAVCAFEYLARTEGIIPAIESAHALSYAMELAPTMDREKIIVVTLSGRGDKDCAAIARYRGEDISE